MIEVTQLSSVYWHVRGLGPCNWSQPQMWPCDEATLRDACHPGASDEFVREALRCMAPELMGG